MEGPPKGHQRALFLIFVFFFFGFVFFFFSRDYFRNDNNNLCEKSARNQIIWWCVNRCWNRIAWKIISINCTPRHTPNTTTNRRTHQKRLVFFNRQNAIAMIFFRSPLTCNFSYIFFFFLGCCWCRSSLVFFFFLLLLQLFLSVFISSFFRLPLLIFCMCVFFYFSTSFIRFILLCSLSQSVSMVAWLYASNVRLLFLLDFLSIFFLPSVHISSSTFFCAVLFLLQYRLYEFQFLFFSL